MGAGTRNRGGDLAIRGDEGLEASVARNRLVVASAHMLFVELVLIRWAGANILHLSYFTNFVLLGAFLGIGLGFLVSRRTDAPPWYGPIVLAALTTFVVLFPVRIDRTTDEVIYFTSLEPSGLPIWVTLPFIFLAVAAVMVASGQLVAKYFRLLDPLPAYRFDLIGAILGIAAFTAMSFLGVGPLGWAVVVVAGYAWLLGDHGRPPIAVAVALLVVVGVMGMQSLIPNTTWSPYYRIDVTDTGGATRLSVNGVPHQEMVSADERVTREPMYGAPYRLGGLESPDRVLVIGAGSGSDVAIALQNGATHVDAVEIDRDIQAIGADNHPDQPYESPEVDVHIDDGRAFLRQAQGPYDLILFALPDSLTLVSGASSLRLESYLFTQEAIDRAHELLAPQGVLALYNYYREAWLVGRLANTLEQSFGHAPCVDSYGDELHAAALVISVAPGQQTCTPGTVSPAGPSPSTDDRPFLYLQGREIPALYLTTLAAILLLSLAAVRVVAGPYRRMRPYADLFLLGAGFLLLETKSVTTFALLFGTTWVVNAIVFGGVLLSVLLAVEVVRLWPTPNIHVMYGVLLASLVLGWLVPNSQLLALPVPLRVIASITLAFLPIFSANVIFAKRLANVADPIIAFGTNLLGAMLGGALEYLALVVGFRNLLLAAGLLYAGAVLVLGRDARASHVAR